MSHVYGTDNVIVTDTAYNVVVIDDNRLTSPSKWNDGRMPYVGNWCGYTGGMVCFIKLSVWRPSHVEYQYVDTYDVHRFLVQRYVPRRFPSIACRMSNIGIHLHTQTHTHTDTQTH